jgi:folate-binding protein YgfZ
MKFVNTKNYSSSIYFDNNYNFFSMVGNDAISFLDRMSTNNIFDVQSSRTVITDNKGSIIDILSYKVIDDKKIIFVSDSDKNKSIEYMKKHVIIDDVELNLIGKLSKIVIFLEKDKIFPDLHKFTLSNTYKNKNFIRYELFASNDELRLLENSKFKKLSLDEKNILDIHMKYICFNQSMIKANPLELGFRNMISFDKGCYVGQEVIARLYNYKKVSREVVPFQTKTELKINSKIIIESKNIGNILNVQKNSGNFVGLCLIKKRFTNLISDEILNI